MCSFSGKLAENAGATSVHSCADPDFNQIEVGYDCADPDFNQIEVGYERVLQQLNTRRHAFFPQDERLGKWEKVVRKARLQPNHGEMVKRF